MNGPIERCQTAAECIANAVDASAQWLGDALALQIVSCALSRFDEDLECEIPKTVRSLIWPPFRRDESAKPPLCLNRGCLSGRVLRLLELLLCSPRTGLLAFAVFSSRPTWAGRMSLLRVTQKAVGALPIRQPQALLWSRSAGFLPQYESFVRRHIGPQCC